MDSRIFVIGLDGCTWRLLETWINNGELPTFESIYRKGARGTLNSTIPSKTCPAVPTLYTGRDPGQLGIFDFMKPDGTSVTLSDIDDPKLWTVLSKADLQSCIVNLRVTYPPEPLNGLMITGFPTPSEESPYTYPKNLKERVGGFQFEKEGRRLRQLTTSPYANSTEIVNIQKNILRERWSTFKNLISEEDYTLNIFWIGGTDFLQHWLWDDNGKLLEFYEVIDGLLAELLDISDGTIYLVSDHGFEKRPSTRFHLNEWLRREGYLQVYGGDVGNRTLATIQRLFRKHVPPKYLHRVLNSIDVRRYLSQRESPPTIDKTIKNIPGISPTSKARMATRWGIEVQVDESQYESIRDSIIEGLSNLQSPSGEEVMKGVWRKEEIYDEGDFFEEIPDIVFQTGTGFYPEGQLSKCLFSPRSGMSGTQGGRSFNAEHEFDREGIIMATGDNISSESGIVANLRDIAPTIIHQLELEIPHSMNGEVLTRLFRPGSDPNTNAPSYRYYTDRRQSGREISIEEHGDIEDRLRDMGYL